jgi:hypothetical protein
MGTGGTDGAFSLNCAIPGKTVQPVSLIPASILPLGVSYAFAVVICGG